MCLQNAGKLAKRYMPDITSMLKHTHANTQTQSGCYSYRTSLLVLESPTTDACVSLMQLQSLIQTHSCAERNWKHAHTDAPFTLAWMPARVLGPKMRTVIGAEPCLMQ